MRDFKGMKRQRGRNRGGGKPGGGSGGGGGNNANRAFDSNGPDGVKVRGHAQHIYEKYQQLSRDAASSGDRVLLENYLQHAEHYYRLIRTLQPQKPPSEIIGRDSFANGYDIDFEDESGEPLAAAAVPEPAEGEGPVDGEQRAEGGEQRRDDRDGRRDRDFNRDGRGEYRDRGDRGDGQQREFRDRGERGDGQREFRGDRQDRGERQDRGDRPERGERQDRGEFRGERGDRPEGQREFRADRPERADRPDRGDRPRRDRDFNRDRGERPEGGYGYGQRRDEQRDGAPAADAEPASAPSGEDDCAMLRDANGGFSPAPAFLQTSVPPIGGGDEPRAPRRRRRSRAEGEVEGGSQPEGGEDPAPYEAEEV